MIKMDFIFWEVNKSFKYICENAYAIKIKNEENELYIYIAKEITNNIDDFSGEKKIKVINNIEYNFCILLAKVRKCKVFLNS